MQKELEIKFTGNIGKPPDKVATFDTLQSVSVTSSEVQALKVPITQCLLSRWHPEEAGENVQ